MVIYGNDRGSVNVTGIRQRKQQRARSARARAARRDAILDAAERLFDERSFAGLPMAQIARELGLAKGTLYLYFPTKESLFLGVAERALSAWFADVDARLSTHAFLSPDALAAELADSFVAPPRLAGLMALLHPVLERNIGEDQALVFKRFLATKVARAGIEFERLLPDLDPGDGARLVLVVHAVVVGLRQACDASPVVARVLSRPDLEHLRLGFRDELVATFAALFRGYQAPPADHRGTGRGPV